MSDNKRYYWLKLPENFFEQKEILSLRQIAGGDTYTIIYQKMLLLSLSHDGLLYYDGMESDFITELALVIHEEKQNVAITVQFLMAKGLLEEITCEEYLLTKTMEMVGSETASTKRSRKSRNSKKVLQCNNDATPMQQIATNCNTEIDIDKELEKELEKKIDIDKEIEIDENVFNKIMNLYQTICKSLSAVKTLSEKRKIALAISLQSYSVDDFEKVFEIAESNSFLCGENKDGWKADFDWLIKSENMDKVLSGKYDAFKNPKVNSFNDFHQREYKKGELQQLLLTTNANCV